MKKYLMIFIMCVAAIVGCRKEWLEEKQNQSYSTLSKVEDLQAMLDNTINYNSDYMWSVELGTDDFYMLDNELAFVNEFERNSYTWASVNNFYGDAFNTDWDLSYKLLFNINTVLENAEKLKPGVINSNWDNVKGSGLFYRAYVHFNLAQLYAKTYDQSSAPTDLGIILKFESDINKISGRSTIQQTYASILDDLHMAVQLLPKTSSVPTRPSKGAAYFLLSRLNLIMGNFPESAKYADSCLNISNALLDYNEPTQLNTGTYPFPRYNRETVFYTRMTLSITVPTNIGFGYVDSTLYKSYATDDLRRSLFFRTLGGRLIFRGSYDAGFFFFNGFATDEMYLTRAECFARAGKLSEAMADLNLLRSKRINKNTYSPLSAATKDDAINYILSERRKELCFRGMRWIDLRRLNKETQYQKTLSRKVNGQVITLPPNDPKYVYPIPNTEVLFNKIPQNPR